MTRLRTSAIAAAMFAALAMTSGAGAQELTPLLAGFAVLAGSTITNTGPTTINGDVGLYPGTSITGLGSITLVPPSAVHQTDATAEQAQIDLATDWGILGAEPSTDLSGHDLGNMVLTPGVYSFSSSAQLTGTLTLDAQGDPGAVFIIQVGSALTTASNSSVVLIHGALGSNVYYVVGSSATLGTGTAFAGKILALDAITLNTGATIDCGAALTQVDAVTLDTNVISTVCAVTTDTFADVLGPTATANETAVGGAIDTYVADVGPLLPEFDYLLTSLSPAELAAAFTQLAGEAGTGAAPAGTQAMNSFLSQVFDTAFEENRGPSTPSPATVKTLGYASENRPSPGPTAALASFNQPSGPDQWGVWAAGYGGYSNTAGDASVGSHDRSATTFGAAAGFDRSVTARTTVGVAISGGHTNFGLSDSLGGGSSTMLQAAVYSRTNFDAAYVATAVAYGYHDVSTDRFVTVPQPAPETDHYAASFSGQDVAARIEAGRRLGWIVPYAALQAQAFFTPAYSETTVSGSSAFALQYGASTMASARTELGVRLEHIIALHDGATLALRSRAAWAHDFGSSPSTTAGFQALAGSSFTVEGAAAAADSLLLSAGAELGFGNGFAIAGTFDSEFAENSQTYAGTGRVSYRW